MESFKKLFPSCCCAPHVEQTQTIFKVKNEELRDIDDSDESVHDNKKSKKASAKRGLYSIQVFPKVPCIKEEESKKEIDSNSNRSSYVYEILELKRRIGTYTMETLFVGCQGPEKFLAFKGADSKFRGIENEAWFGVPLKNNRSNLEEFSQSPDELSKVFFSIKKEESSGFFVTVSSNENLLFSRLLSSFQVTSEPIKISFSKSYLEVMSTSEGQLLIHLNGEQKLVFDKEENDTVTIGRKADNTVVLKDEFASKRQMSFHWKGNCWKIKDGFKDSKSMNGNWILIQNRSRVVNGMQLRLGRNFFDAKVINSSEYLVLNG